MTEQEKKAVLLLANTAERALHENFSLKAMLRSFVKNPQFLSDWKNLLDEMMKDESLLEPIREKFRYIYDQIEHSADPSAALKALLRDFPVSGKEN
jgi:hypothetical protein